MDNMENQNVVTPEPSVEEAPVADKKTIGGMVDSAVDAGKDFVQNLQVEEKAKGLWDKIKTVPMKLWIAAGAALAVLIALIIVISAASNNYKTPLKIMEKQMNAKRYVSEIDQSIQSLNGFTKKEMKAIAKLMKKTEDYKDDLKDAKEDFKDYRDELEDEYGKNVKFSIKIEDKDKLDKDDLKDFRDELRTTGKFMEGIAEEAEDFDSDDWEDAADSAGLKKGQMKKLVKQMKKLGKQYKKAKVTKGYELDIVIRIKGKELDEPEEIERTIYVYKVNGRWISEDALDGVDLF